MTDRLAPDTGPAYFAYDAPGNRAMMQDGSGATYWAYDALNRAWRPMMHDGSEATYWSCDALNRPWER